MKKDSERYWFPAVRYGWGWGLPVTWEGWIVFSVFIVAVFIVSFLIDPIKSTLLFSVANLIVLGILIGICWKKGEPPKWRWGDED